MSRSGANVERRKWPRLPLAIPVFVKSRDDKGKEFLEFATALNISAAGALVAVRRILPLSSQLLLEIPSAPLAATAKLPKAARSLRAKCVRVTNAEGYYLAGLKFSRPLLPDSKIKQTRQRKGASVDVKTFSPGEVAAPV
ncbi:MAG TPA: PilZ domain-containing protein [Terriglobales bacterium]|nr:PilZ domain-containing protein [Terriglobales bacterium]